MTLQKSFIFLKLGLILGISYTLADLTGFTIATKLKKQLPQATQNQSYSGASKISTVKHNLDHYSVIFKKNIFEKEKIPEIVQEVQQKAVEQTETKMEAEQIPLSPLNFKLVGIAFRGGKGYKAFLENKKTRKQKSYGIGDLLQPEVVVVVINPKSVIVERNGKREIIEYPVKAKKERIARQRRGTKRTGARTPAPTNGARTLDKRYIDNELKNMGRLMTQIRAVPVGKEGFKVFNIAKGSLFEKIGLENGDLINRINGIELSSPDKAMEMYMQLKGSTEIQLDFIRNGSQMNQSYSIR